MMVRRCTYRAQLSGIQGDHRDDLVEEEGEDEDEDDVLMVMVVMMMR